MVFFHNTKNGSLTELVRKRYESFDTELGAQIEVICSHILHTPHSFPNSFRANACLHLSLGW